MVKLLYLQPLEKWITDPVKSTATAFYMLCVLCICLALGAVVAALRRPKKDLYQLPDLQSAAHALEDGEIPQSAPLLKAYTGKRIYGWTRKRTLAAVGFALLSLVCGNIGYHDMKALQLWRLADTAAHRHDSERAARLNKEAINLVPRSRVAHTRLAQSLIECGKPKEAIEHLKTAVRGEVIDATPWMLLGDCWMHLGNPAEAERAYREAQRIAPHNPEINVLTGLALVRQHKLGAAEQEYLFAIRSNREYARALACLGTLQSATGRTEEGLENLKHAARNAATDPLIRDSLAMAYARMGDAEHAASEFRAEISIDPDKAVPYFNLAHALESCGQPAAALNCYEAFIRKCAQTPGPQIMGVPQAIQACNRLRSQLYHIPMPR